MISLPEQLTAARKWQFEAQLDLFHALTSQVFARTEQVIALNLDTSRAAVERSSKAVKQLFAINDPRDLVTLGSQGQEQFQQMLAYSRELFSIASGAAARPAAATPWTAPAMQVEATAWTPPAPQAAPAPRSAPAYEPESAPATNGAHPGAAPAWQGGSGVKPSKRPLVATPPEPAPEPAAQHTPIAEAASMLAPHADEPQHPLSSPVTAASPEVEIPPIEPVEAAPPPAPVSGTPEIEIKNAQRTKGKGNRKK